MSDPRANAVRSASALAGQVRTEVIGAEQSGMSWPELARTLREISEFSPDDVAALDLTSRLLAVACLEDLQHALVRNHLPDEAASVAQTTRVLTTPRTPPVQTDSSSAPQPALDVSESAIA